MPGEIDRHQSYNNSDMPPLLSVLMAVSSITAFIGALRKFKPFPHGACQVEKHQFLF